MLVTLLGKEFRSGTSKKGNDYTAVVVYLAAHVDGIEGMQTNSLFLDAKKYPIESLVLGAKYDVVMGLNGYLQSFKLVEMPKHIVKEESM